MPSPPPSKQLSKKDKLVLKIIGGVVVLCSGGAALIGSFAGDSADPEPTVTAPAPHNVADPVPTTTAPTPDAVAASREAVLEASREAKRKADEERALKKEEERLERELREQEARQAEGEEDEPASAYYANCSAARDAGAAPLHKGEPGYRSGLDRDKDGIACDT